MLKEHRLAGRETHDVFHRVFDRLDKAGRRLGVFVLVVGGGDFLRLGVPVEPAHAALHTVLMKQPDVEPDRRVERTILVHAQPSQLAIKMFRILRTGKQAILAAPVGDRPCHAVNQITNRCFTLGGVGFPVEIFADDDVRRHLRPVRGHVHVELLENRLAAFRADPGRTLLPTRLIKRMLRPGAKHGGNGQPLLSIANRLRFMGRRLGFRFRLLRFGFVASHHSALFSRFAFVCLSMPPVDRNLVPRAHQIP